MEKRIIQLETLSAMQDEAIASLNTEIFRQQQDVVQLRQRLDLLEQKLLDLNDPEEIAGSERPPHY
ncbi:MAG: SlyX family protein [Pontiella sp.]